MRDGDRRDRLAGERRQPAVVEQHDRQRADDGDVEHGRAPQSAAAYVRGIPLASTTCNAAPPASATTIAPSRPTAVIAPGEACTCGSMPSRSCTVPNSSAGKFQTRPVSASASTTRPGAANTCGAGADADRRPGLGEVGVDQHRLRGATVDDDDDAVRLGDLELAGERGNRALDLGDDPIDVADRRLRAVQEPRPAVVRARLGADAPVGEQGCDHDGDHRSGDESAEDRGAPALHPGASPTRLRGAQSLRRTWLRSGGRSPQVTGVTIEFALRMRHRDHSRQTRASLRLPPSSRATRCTG